jgi:hypothetical protein
MAPRGEEHIDEVATPNYLGTYEKRPDYSLLMHLVNTEGFHNPRGDVDNGLSPVLWPAE